ncbi:MAG: hypothetical protein EZS28_027095 [Streblomastix strix]|uniref:Uncharacterized protein n=1 Tax=Streblomastix strix TaxID=222440 RepID=A0A5J4V3P4_9EUKA|nr:MAG: hypothetical protein EZS28_027095 [Streblomastix strix]
MLAGIGLLVIGLVNIYSTSLCSCFPCCRTINPKFLRTSFLSSFAATFELLLFGGSYLFFEKGWINKAIVTGNKAYFNGLSLDKGGNINDLINEHFIYFRIDAILCIVGFVVTVISCIFCICLLNPEQYLKQMPFIEDQIILICGTEFIFLGAFFKVLDTYSNSIDAIMTATITIGSIIDYSFLMLKILNCFSYLHIGKDEII